MNPGRRWSLVLVFLLAGAAGGVTASRADIDHERAKSLVDAGIILPLETILAKARRAHPGKVLESELEHRKGRYIYELEILDKRGVVWKLHYDASTGVLLKTRPDD